MELEFRRYDAERARAVRDMVAFVHREAYAEQIAANDAFADEDAFMRRFDAYATRPDFDMVIACRGDQPVAQAWGWPLTVRSGEAWWRGLAHEPEPGFTHEDGSRTFALSEIMVAQAWAGQGVGHAVHDELLSARTESRAVLLVRPRNARAYRAYTAWGWRKAGELRPDLPHAVVMDVLVLPLPVPPP